MTDFFEKYGGRLFGLMIGSFSLYLAYFALTTKTMGGRYNRFPLTDNEAIFLGIAFSVLGVIAICATWKLKK